VGSLVKLIVLEGQGHNTLKVFSIHGNWWTSLLLALALVRVFERIQLLTPKGVDPGILHAHGGLAGGYTLLRRAMSFIQGQTPLGVSN